MKLPSALLTTACLFFIIPCLSLHQARHNPTMVDPDPVDVLALPPADPARIRTLGCEVSFNAACPLTELNILDIKRGVSSPAACQKLCRAAPDCGFFTHYEQICYLLKTCPFFEICTGCVSGPRLPDVDTCEIADSCDRFSEGTCNLDEYNILVFVNSVESPRVCQTVCRERAGCNYFTHFLEQCYLLYECTSWEKCEGCVSGPTQPDLATCPWPPAGRGAGTV